MTGQQARHGAGTSKGGQFAASERPEGDVALATPPTPADDTDPFRRGRSGAIPGGGTWATFRHPEGASFNPWRGRLDVSVSESLEDMEDEDVPTFAKTLGERLGALPFAEHDDDFETAVDSIRDAEDLDDLERALDEIYDWGDARRYIIQIGA